MLRAAGHRMRDVEEVFPELAGHVLVSRVVSRQFHGYRQHVQRVHRHPAGAVGLLEMATCRQRRTTVEYSDVVESQESALEHVHPLGVLAIHPPGEIQQQFVEDALEEDEVTCAATTL